MKIIASMLFALGLVAAAPFSPRAVITGVAEVVDGDGVSFGEVEIRLQGIAAPEDSRKYGQPGGAEATANLKRIVEGKIVRCDLDGTVTPRSNRPAGICYLDDQDVGAMQVRQGFARDCPKYSGGRYAADEAAARASGHDLSKTYKLPGYC